MSLSPDAQDPELQALPQPRRPWRRATLVTLLVTAICSISLCWGLLKDGSFALVGGQPTELSNLRDFEPGSARPNSWVHGTAILGDTASGYRRPLDPDRFRLAPVEGNPRLWIEMREPAGALNEHFVPPSSFVGRLVPVAASGLRHSGLVEALERSGQPAPASDAWLLIDGESPDSQRWVLGVMLLLLIFAGFCAWGMYTLLAPVRSRGSVGA